MRLAAVPACALALAAISAGSAAVAQDEPPPKPQEEPLPPPLEPPKDPTSTTPVELPDPASPGFVGFAMGDYSEGVDVGNERVIAASGSVSAPLWVKLPGFELRCESMVIWGNRDRLIDAVDRRREVLAEAKPETILGPLVHAVYAEGGVYVRMNKQTIRAERVFLDFVSGKAFMVKAVMTAEVEGRRGDRPLPLTVRAETIRATTRNTYRAENAEITTCNYADPHFEFHTGAVEVDYRDSWATFETDWFPTVRADTVLGDDMPIFVLPKLGGNSGLVNTPIQSVSFSQSSRMGTSVLTTWGGDVRRGDGSKWGEWKVHADHRSARGPGLGADVSHEGSALRPGGPRDEMEFSGYWQRDDESTDSFSDRAFDGGTDPDTNRRDRGFSHFFGRWFVKDPWASESGSDWRVDTEVSYYSDRGYFAEYDRKKAESEKQQETYLHARKTWGNQGVSLFASYRLNDEASYLDKAPTDLYRTNFENQTQYGPSATYHLVNHPLLRFEDTGFAPLNLSVQASAANVKRREDDRLADRRLSAFDWSGEWVRRGDLETRFTTPFSICDLHVSPAFGGSFLAVDDANGWDRQSNGSNSRLSGFYGVRADTQAWRTWPDVLCPLLDLDGLRHVASLDGQYFDRFAVSDDPLSFQSNDPVDELAEQRIGSVRVRNRLQTKRDDEVIDWLDVESRFLYFFDEAPAVPRDLLGVREDFAQPLQNLDFAGEAKYTTTTRDGSAFWQHRARLQFLRRLWLVGEADYDMDHGAFESSAAGVRWAATDVATFYVGRRTIHGDSTIWTERLDYRLSNRWGVTAQYQADTKEDEGLRTTFSLYRRAHDYTIAVEYDADSQGDDRAVWFAIYPNAWVGSRTDPFSQRRPLDYDAMKWYR
jgi:hypothetical protein